MLVIIQDYKFIPAGRDHQTRADPALGKPEKRQYHSVWFEALGEEEPEDYLFPEDSYERSFDQPGSLPLSLRPAPGNDSVASRSSSKHVLAYHADALLRVLPLNFSVWPSLSGLSGFDTGGTGRGYRTLYQDHCAQCHNPKRLGGMGPALLPGNLKRLRKPAAIEVISQGRVATQMPAFADKLDSAEIESLVEYIYTPSNETLAWGLAEINASHIQHNRVEDLPAQPGIRSRRSAEPVPRRRTRRPPCHPARR